MDIDQCVDVLRSLKDAYQQISQEGDVSTNKVLELKHTVTELELLLISIKKSMKNIEAKQNISKQNKNSRHNKVKNNKR